MSDDIAEFEGLVHATASKFADMVRVERADLEQELRIVVLRAMRSYDPSLCRTNRRLFVFSCVTNRVKDFKRDAARRANGPLHVTHIEEYFDLDDSGEFQWFEHQYLMISHDEVYGQGEGVFVMPATVTSEEQEIIYLLVIGYAQTEIAVQLELEYTDVVKRMRVLREKFRDWKPSPGAVAPPATVAPQAIAA